MQLTRFWTELYKSTHLAWSFFFSSLSLLCLTRGHTQRTNKCCSGYRHLSFLILIDIFEMAGAPVCARLCQDTANSFWHSATVSGWEIWSGWSSFRASLYLLGVPLALLFSGNKWIPGRVGFWGNSILWRIGKQLLEACRRCWHISHWTVRWSTQVIYNMSEYYNRILCSCVYYKIKVNIL